eukprot:TRINITY_DN8715_c0_g1_i1.p1 TRINITY_DN8715_c0_g1~~TRINITY_DN8715_c0_g1_i1.p1  ORF type:complete len:315 (-),score=54.70 TRINITY_DN8715_c0_g1_i1:412-1356(-)
MANRIGRNFATSLAFAVTKLVRVSHFHRSMATGRECASSPLRPLIALGQLTSTSDVENNFQNCEALVDQAVRRGAQLISFPENFAYFADKPGEALKLGLTLDGPLFTRYRVLAKKGIWISYGGFPVIAEDGQHGYNTHVIVDDQGEIRASYRKIHLFKVAIKGGPTLDETAGTFPGSDVVVVDSPVGRLGLTVCYDLRFPELFVALRQKGAEVILVPSAFTVVTGMAHWEVLLRARAIETQCYVAAAAQGGAHNPSRSTYGHSLIADPWGAVVVACPDTYPSLCFAEVDHSRIEQVRASMPVMEHRRPELYKVV